MTSHLVEVYESPGWMDDGFRSGWTLFSGGGTLANAGTIAGDYAVETPTSGVPPECAFKKTVSGGLSTDTYPVLRIRVRGSSADSQCAATVVYTDGSYDSTWMFTPGVNWVAKMLQLAAGKTIDYVKVEAKTAAVHWDYVALLRHPPLIPEEIEELEVDLQTTLGVSGFRLRMLNDPCFESCVLRLPFDENFGSKAYDLSKYKNHGAISGASWVDGKYGKALSLDGIDDYVNVPDANSLDITSAITLAAWIRCTTNPAATCAFLAKRYAYQLQYTTTGKAQFGAQISGVWYFSPASNNSLSDNVWHHVVGVYDGSYIRLYVDGVQQGTTAQTGSIDVNTEPVRVGTYYDTYYFGGKVDEVRIYNRALTAAEVYDHYVSSPLSGGQRAGVGDIAMVYLAGEGETLSEKLVKGRIIDRERGGEPDNPTIELVGESMDELLLERTYTDEFASAAQISAIVADIIDDQFPEFTRSSVDVTNLTLMNKFDEEGVFELLKKLAETAQYSDGTKGANFWVDPGGDFHFEKVCKWAGPDLTDGSDGGTRNLLSVAVKETMKGQPKVANDLRLIIFEAEHEPKNQDSWTEVDPNQTSVPYWTVYCDNPGDVIIQPEYVDVKCGNSCVDYHVSITLQKFIEMRLTLPTAVDISTFNRLRLWLKRAGSINVDVLNFYIETKESWWGAYYKLEGLAPPALDTWSDQNRSLSGFTAVGDPGKWATRVNIRFDSTAGLASGDIRIDKLRFERDEKAKTASDSTSQSRYGRRRLVTVDKTITKEETAQKIVDGMLDHRKDHTVQATVLTMGKSQVGFRPPQRVKVTSLKDGLNGAYFQVVSARHRYVPQDIYTCELSLIAAVKSDGTNRPDIVPQNPPGYLAGILARHREDMYMQGLAHRQREPHP